MTKIYIPTNCPACDFKLEFVNMQLFCKNLACSAQLGKKLEHFCKVLGIKGMGPKTLEKLEFNDLTEIFYQDVNELAEKLDSDKIAQKLYNEIEAAKTAPLNTVLASFSIPLVGETAANKICLVISSIDDINYETCKEAGLGEKVTANLIGWLTTDFKEMREFLPFSWQITKKVVANADAQTVCISGKLTSFKTKAEAHKQLEALGFKCVETVTKTLSYLVDEQQDGSSKRKKAETYSIPIITNLNIFLKENS